MKIGPTMGRPGDEPFLSGADVEHICPECGGDFATHLGATGAVVRCWGCHGRGRMNDLELSIYLRKVAPRS